MNIEERAQEALNQGFQSIAIQFDLPYSFPPQVVSETDAITHDARARRPDFFAGRRDATEIPFVTLDPTTSTDLDQAFAIEQDGEELVLHYALADVGAFVPAESKIEKEAWQRGLTIYGLAEKIPLYPKEISQGVASLLPDGIKPAVLVSVALSPSGKVRLLEVDRVLCRSRAKLAYDSVDLSKVPFIEEFARRMWADEVARGAMRVEFPQQEVVVDESAPGGVRLVLRPRVLSESMNSTLSLAVNMALGALLQDAQLGLFRIMDDPSDKNIDSLRRTAHALGIDWLPAESLRDLQRRMDPQNYTHQRFLLDARRAGGRARYAVYNKERPAWHSAIGSTYSHATAPMRRLADRYVLDLAFLVANGKQIPTSLSEKVAKLPAVMERCEGRAASVERAVIDLLEAVSLQHRVGELLTAEVVDAANGIVQTNDSAIRAKATNLNGAQNGARVQVRIDVADPNTRTVRLSAI